MCKSPGVFCFIPAPFDYLIGLWSANFNLVPKCKLSNRQLFCFLTERSICPSFLCLHSREYSTKAEWAGCIRWWRCQARDVEIMCWNVTSWSDWWKCQDSYRTYLQLTFGEVYVGKTVNMPCYVAFFFLAVGKCVLPICNRSLSLRIALVLTKKTEGLVRHSQE